MMPIEDLDPKQLTRWWDHISDRNLVIDGNMVFLQQQLIIYFVITVCAVALLPDRLQLTLGLPLIAIALLGLGAYAWLRFWLCPRFYFVDYSHARR